MNTSGGKLLKQKNIDFLVDVFIFYGFYFKN